MNLVVEFMIWTTGPDIIYTPLLLLAQDPEKTKLLLFRQGRC